MEDETAGLVVVGAGINGAACWCGGGGAAETDGRRGTPLCCCWRAEFAAVVGWVS